MKHNRFIICFITALVFFLVIFIFFTDDTASKVTGKITVWADNQNYEYLNSMAQKYIASNEKTTIDVINIDDSNFLGSIDNAIKSNVLPDIVTVDSSDMRTVVEKYSNDIQLKPNNKIADDYSKDFTKRELQEGTVSGNLLAVPFSSTPIVMYVNQAVLNSYGYNIEDLNTWNDIIRIGKDINTKSGGKIKIINATGTDNNYLESLLLMQQLENSEDEETVKTNYSKFFENLKSNNILNYDNNGQYIIKISSIDGMKDISSTENCSGWISTVPPAEASGKNKFYISSGKNLAELYNNESNSKLREAFLRYIVANKTDIYQSVSKGNFFCSYLTAYDKAEVENQINNFTGQSPVVIMENVATKAPDISEYDLFIKLKNQYSIN